jgi:hypothetical protein
VPVQDNISNRLVKLEKAFGRVFQEAMNWAEEDFQKEIQTVKWNWPNETFRKNGKRAETTRDIVDLGGLLRSQKRENIGDNKTIFTWTGALDDGSEEAYALEVHDGYVHKDSKERMLDRPFTDHAIQQLPDIVEKLLEREVKANG